MSYAEVFSKRPESWGLRGDPFLWDALGWHLSSQNTTSSQRAKNSAATELERALDQLTNGLFNSGVDEAKISWLPRGGMSGGMIHIQTWRMKLIPQILQRIELASQKASTAVDYHPAEHRFRFASWCAATDARNSRSVCTFSVQYAADLLRNSPVRFCALGPHWLPHAEHFDRSHSEWCVGILKQAQMRYPDFSYGIAAKLINFFLKAIFIGQFGSGFFDPYGVEDSDGAYASRIDSIHPPVDRLLLKALADADVGGFQNLWRVLLAKGWSKFDEADYKLAIDLINKSTNNRPWNIEFHCLGILDKT